MSGGEAIRSIDWLAMKEVGMSVDTQRENGISQEDLDSKEMREFMERKAQATFEVNKRINEKLLQANVSERAS